MLFVDIASLFTIKFNGRNNFSNVKPKARFHIVARYMHNGQSLFTFSLLPILRNIIFFLDIFTTYFHYLFDKNSSLDVDVLVVHMLHSNFQNAMRLHVLAKTSLCFSS